MMLVFLGITIISCSNHPKKIAQEENPFFSEFDTPFKVPPFNKIKQEHFLPAFKEGIKQHQKEIKTIVSSSESPTFENTIEALDRSGSLLTQTGNVFDNLLAALTNDELQRIAEEAAPLRSKHNDDIRLNAGLFARIIAVHAQMDNLNLHVEQSTLLEKFYKDFVRGGAKLSADKQARLREINLDLSILSLKFGENILKENNAFEMVLTSEENLAGLPQSVITGAAEAAKERNHAGKWVFTLHKPSMIPFLQFSDKRNLREKIFKAYIKRGDNDNKFDNKSNLAKMASLRVEKAQLLG